MQLKELLWLFFVYSFAGWMIETVVAAIKNRRFVNRGLINGPFCVMYGFVAVVLTVTLQELSGVQLVLFAAIYATVIEWITGHLIEKIWKERWWDYSNHKWNIGGYICLSKSVLWGISGYLALRWGNLFLHTVYKDFSNAFMTIVLWVLGVALLLDVLADVLRYIYKNHMERLERWNSIDHFFGR